jgi:SPP1 gp7 family putative phage head morphogenesis protein
MSGSYWLDRFEVAEKAREIKAEAYCETLKKEYARSKKRIEDEIAGWYARFAKNNVMTLSEAKIALDKREMKELKWTLEDYIKRGTESDADGRWVKELENASARAHIDRLTALNLNLRAECETLYGKELTGVTALLKDTYTGSRLRAAYEIQRGLGVGVDFALPDGKRLDYVLSKPWAADGRVFSSRIWTSRDKLVNTLQTELTQNLMLGEGPDGSIRRVAKEFGVSEREASRLVMTESAYAAAIGDLDGYKELGVEFFEFVATLDGDTSALCRGLHGVVEAIENYTPGVTVPPLHPWCRSTTVPAFEDEPGFAERLAENADGKAYYVSKNEGFPEWKKRFAGGETAPKALVEGNFESVPDLNEKLGASAEKTHELAGKYTGKVGKWNGTVVYAPSKNNAKFWDCSIQVNASADESILIHEHLHARSASSSVKEVYKNNWVIEEASVQALTEEICKAENIVPAPSGYADHVTALRELASELGLGENFLEFSLDLFAAPLDSREAWLYAKITETLGYGASVTDIERLSAIAERATTWITKNG